ncbi:MAG: A/G-specific adenine glycosylase [Culicoidibacterales bacterium]
MNKKQFETTIINWFDQHKRELPWRKTTDPYAIWVSEIMLQQTQVIRVIDYYQRFLRTFPTITSLAQASETDILKAWEGLGYYSRVRNMQKAAQYIENNYNGEFPRTYEQIVNLPGIGSYTAGAICACAYGLAYPAVDGNVLRVLSRYEASDADIMKQKTKRIWENYISQIITEQNPSFFNQGLIELGALICTPTQPKCSECPLQMSCCANRQGIQEQFPVKMKKKPAKELTFETILYVYNDAIAIMKNEAKGVLQYMWSLPQYDVDERESEESYCQTLEEQIPQAVEDISLFGQYRHVFSHQIWQMRVWIVHVNQPVFQDCYTYVTPVELLMYPMANSHKKIVNAYLGSMTLLDFVAEVTEEYSAE